MLKIYIVCYLPIWCIYSWWIEYCYKTYKSVCFLYLITKLLFLNNLMKEGWKLPGLWLWNLDAYNYWGEHKLLMVLNSVLSKCGTIMCKITDSTDYFFMVFNRILFDHGGYWHNMLYKTRLPGNLNYVSIYTHSLCEFRWWISLLVIMYYVILCTCIFVLCFALTKDLYESTGWHVPIDEIYF